MFKIIISLLADLDPVYGSLLEEIYKINKNNVYSQAYSIVKDQQDAEEVVQDVFLRTYFHIQKLENKSPGQIVLWLRICTKNRSIDYLRKKKQLHTVSINEQEDDACNAEIPDPSPNPDELYINREKISLVREKVRNLPFEQSTAIIYRYYFNMPEKEIAEIMGKKPSAVSSLIYRAKKRMEKELEDIV